MDSPTSKPPEKTTRGRKRYEPTATDFNTVKNMVAAGFRQHEIARCIGDYGVDEKTLRKHFKRELATSAPLANATVASKVFEAAKRGEPWACRFWLKCRAGWKETEAHEISGPGGGPVVTTEVPASERLARRVAAIVARLGTLKAVS